MNLVSWDTTPTKSGPACPNIVNMTAARALALQYLTFSGLTIKVCRMIPQEA